MSKRSKLSESGERDKDLSQKGQEEIEEGIQSSDEEEPSKQVESKETKTAKAADLKRF